METTTTKSNPHIKCHLMFTSSQLLFLLYLGERMIASYYRSRKGLPK